MEHFNRKQIEEMKKLLAVGKVPTNANPHLIFAAAKALFVDGLKFDLRPGWFVDLETRTEPFHEVPDLGRETYKIYKEFFDDEKKGPQRRRNYVVDSRAHFIDYREENGNCVCGDKPCTFNNSLRPRDPEGVNEQLPDDFNMDNIQPVGVDNLVRPRDPGGVNEQLPDDFDMGNVQPVGDNNLVRPRDPEGVNEQLPDDFDMGNVQPVGDNSLVPPLHLEGVNEQLADDFDNGRARPPIYQPIAIEESRCHRRRRRRRPRTMLLINPDIMTQASITGMHENPTDDDDNGVDIQQPPRSPQPLPRSAQPLPRSAQPLPRSAQSPLPLQLLQVPSLSLPSSSPLRLHSLRAVDGDIFEDLDEIMKILRRVQRDHNVNYVLMRRRIEDAQSATHIFIKMVNLRELSITIDEQGHLVADFDQNL